VAGSVFLPAVVDDRVANRRDRQKGLTRSDRHDDRMTSNGSALTPSFLLVAVDGDARACPVLFGVPRQGYGW